MLIKTGIDKKREIFRFLSFSRLLPPNLEPFLGGPVSYSVHDQEQGLKFWLLNNADDAGDDVDDDTIDDWDHRDFQSAEEYTG